MNKILLPIDFSENSENATDYACQIALDGDFELELVHVFSQHSNTYLNAQNDTPLHDPRIKDAEISMKSVLEKIENKYPEIKLSSTFRDGNLYDEIKKLTNAYDYSAIVMGTKGASGLEALFIGSNTYDTILNTKTPVFAIPINATGFKKNKIGLLCNFKEGEIKALAQAMPLLKNNFHLVLIHVNSTDKAINEIDNELRTWIEKLEGEFGKLDISYTIKPQTLFMRQKE
ncbi:MAG: universal stress protein, partial [Sphingobacterium sp.]